ncbi:MAG: hypothetical protein ABIH23_24045, partial [bacterium]
MKRMVAFVLVVFITASFAHAVNFTPTLLKLSAPATVQYDFDGTVLEIPITVSGTRAGVFFCVFTKDQAEQISAVRNGYLGWHYVNKIDTCMYTSPLISLDIGQNKISWDGKDDDGKMVPSGEYTYYLWAYDNVGVKTKVYLASNLYPFRDGNLEEWGPEGEPLVNPLFISKSNKWTIGNDPDDITLLETTNLVLPEGFGRKERMQLDPFDHKYIYGFIGNDDTGNVGVWKFQWVPNGDAVLATDFGEDGKCTLPVSGLGGSKNYRNVGVGTDRNYLYSVFCLRNEPVVNYYLAEYITDSLRSASQKEIEHFNAPAGLKGGTYFQKLTAAAREKFAGKDVVFAEIHVNGFDGRARPEMVDLTALFYQKPDGTNRIVTINADGSIKGTNYPFDVSDLLNQRHSVVIEFSSAERFFG